jgi:hypothetical protein
LNLKLSEGGFHPTTLVYFRQRLIEHAKADVAMVPELRYGEQVELLRQVFAPAQLQSRLPVSSASVFFHSSLTAIT